MFIEIKELYFKYPKSKNDIIDNFNMSLEKGEILSILGESGSGKSTILSRLCFISSYDCEKKHSVWTKGQK